MRDFLNVKLSKLNRYVDTLTVALVLLLKGLKDTLGNIKEEGWGLGFEKDRSGERGR